MNEAIENGTDCCESRISVQRLVPVFADFSEIGRSISASAVAQSHRSNANRCMNERIGSHYRLSSGETGSGTRAGWREMVLTDPPLHCEALSPYSSHVPLQEWALYHRNKRIAEKWNPQAIRNLRPIVSA